MKTFKKSAVSHDNPEYLIRNKNILLHKNGNTYFSSIDRNKYVLPTLKSAKTIDKECKFGLSKDSPFHSRHTCVHTTSTSIFDDPYRLKDNKYSRFGARIQPNLHIRECLKKSGNDTPRLIKLLRSELPAAHSVKNTFTLFMDKSMPHEQKVFESLLNRFNVHKLNSSARHPSDSPYNAKLEKYMKAIDKSMATEIKRLPRNGFVSRTFTNEIYS